MAGCAATLSTSSRAKTSKASAVQGERPAKIEDYRSLGIACLSNRRVLPSRARAGGNDWRASLGSEIFCGENNSTVRLLLAAGSDDVLETRLGLASGKGCFHSEVETHKR